MSLQPKTTINKQRNPQKGATTVEYAVIVVAMVLAVFATIIYLANPNDADSLLPGTFNKVSTHIGNFQILNIPE